MSICRALLYGEKKPVFYSSPNMRTSDPCFIYIFDNDISDTSLSRQECGASTCALATLLFAKYFMDEPSEFVDTEIPDKVYCQVIEAIQKSIDIYQQEFSDQAVTLTPVEACEMLKNELGQYEVVSVSSLDDIVHDTLIGFMTDLPPGHLLLLHQQIPYNVLSMINIHGNDRILIFNSQKRCRKAYGGAYIFSSEKVYSALSVAIFSLHGWCESLAANKYTLTVLKIL